MWIWLIGGAAGLILLALILHFAVPGKAIKVPTIILSTFGGLVVGIVLGLLGAVMYGESIQKQVYGDQYKADPMPSGMTPPSAAGGGGGGGGGAPPETKKEAPPAVGGGPGGTNLGADYPGMTKKAEPPK